MKTVPLTLLLPFSAPKARFQSATFVEPVDPEEREKAGIQGGAGRRGMQYENWRDRGQKG